MGGEGRGRGGEGREINSERDQLCTSTANNNDFAALTLSCSEDEGGEQGKGALRWLFTRLQRVT